VTLRIKLTHDEPRLVYLALVYHLGRPGSELDPATRQPRAHGMRELELALGSQLGGDAVIDLDEDRYRRLLSAMNGCVTELRLHHMREGAPSTVERFTETARATFPALAVDPAAALDVAEAMMMCRRRLQRAVARATLHPNQG
jgi:hypothetical protein